ncbi:FMN reductase [NAD(P)H] [bacterium HR26]|nr:FMN reductase [NAD(P)H] [bacterium HR26]
MDFAEVVRKRRMVRHFKADPFARESLERILDLARRAPSAGYTQGQSFIVVTDPERRRAVADACDESFEVKLYGYPWISEAPVQIVACTSEEAYRRGHREPEELPADGSEIDWPVPYWCCNG